MKERPTFPKGALESGQPPHYCGAPTEISGKVDIRPATAADAALCARLYQAEAVHFVRRVEEFAEHFSRLEEFPRAEDWMIEMQGQALAYMFLGLPWEYGHQPGTQVREVLEYAGSRTALAAGCTHPRLAQAMVQSNLAELRLLIPRQDVDLLQLLRAQGAAGEAMEMTGHTMRVVNFPGLMSDLRSYVKGRLTEEQRRGLRFEQQGERYAMVRGQERLELDTAGTTRLVMGSVASPAVALDTTGRPRVLGQPANWPALAGSTGILAGILSALFPLPSFLPGLNYR